MVPTLGSFTMGSAASVLIIVYLVWFVLRHKNAKLQQNPDE
jgi:hypothetical protein